MKITKNLYEMNATRQLVDFTNSNLIDEQMKIAIQIEIKSIDWLTF